MLGGVLVQCDGIGFGYYIMCWEGIWLLCNVLGWVLVIILCVGRGCVVM